MNYQFSIEKATTYTEDDINHLKEQRKFWARREQGCKDKKERKICQRYVKAITFCIRYMEGEPTEFPLELQSAMVTAFCFATDVPRTHYADIHTY